MDLILSAIILAGLFWLHRRDRAAAERAAYAAGYDDAQAAAQNGTRHGLKPLPKEATWRTDN